MTIFSELGCDDEARTLVKIMHGSRKGPISTVDCRLYSKDSANFFKNVFGESLDELRLGLRVAGGTLLLKYGDSLLPAAQTYLRGFCDAIDRSILNLRIVSIVPAGNSNCHMDLGLSERLCQAPLNLEP